ncbi:O-antigen ligase family protein [Paractinoplanes hotanensis]|uniref:O-antigen ligase family protein n=1 Tax=Paractinoplanes hotanensis TaxID=2906497 RepID=A0ABT0XWM5_9ACTN|nr:O-antigen ligase family protein [Actinoplanes hotanensis]MCM4078191.1 O-antigen ligase family protein [Actinoplanes hotanensis]
MTGEIRRRPGLVVIIAFVATLAGHFTLARVGFTVPVFNDVRLPLFAALLASFALEIRWAPRGRQGAAPILLAIYAFLGYQAVSSAWTPPGALVSAALTDLVAIALLVFVYAQLAEWDRDRVVALTMGCFQAAAWVYFLAAAAGLGRGPAGRWAALGGGPNVFVRLMVLGIFSSIYLYATRRRLGWLVGVPAFLFGAVASGSRGGLVALALTVVLAAPAVLPGLRRGGAKPLLLVIALLVGGVAIAGDSILAFVQQRFISTTFEQGYASGRDVIFQMALNLWLQHPLLGTGIGSFPVIADLGFGVAYIHNLVLAVAAEGGIVGIVLLLNSFYQFRRQFTRVPRAERSLESRTAAYSGIFVAAACMFSGDYYDARLMWILLILAVVRPAESAAPRP